MKFLKIAVDKKNVMAFNYQKLKSSKSSAVKNIDEMVQLLN